MQVLIILLLIIGAVIGIHHGENWTPVGVGGADAQLRRIVCAPSIGGEWFESTRVVPWHLGSPLFFVIRVTPVQNFGTSDKATGEYSSIVVFGAADVE